MTALHISPVMTPGRNRDLPAAVLPDAAPDPGSPQDESGHRQTRSGRALPVLVIIAVAVLCMMPALVSGDMRTGHDYASHIQWQDAFARQFWGGERYPRWMTDLNQGFGSPVFFIYPPLPYYATALLSPLFASPDLATADLRLAVSATFALSLGGIAAYLWLLRHSAGRIGPLLGALAFMMTPYHLLVDTYVRSSFAELWSFVVMPLGLLAVDRIGRSRAAGFCLLCLTIAAACMIHPPSALVVLPMFGAYAVAVSARAGSLAAVLVFAAAVPVSGMIAAAYLAPALLPFHSVSGELFSGKYVSANGLLGFANLSNPEFPKVIYLAAGLQGLGFLALAAALRMIAPLRRFRQPVVFAVALMLVTAVMMSEPSRWFWDLGTPANRIQFPWRMLGVQGISLAVLLCAVFDAAPRLSAVWGKRLRSGCLLFAAGLFAANLGFLAALQRGAPARLPKVTQDTFRSNPEPAEYRLGDTARMARRFPGGVRVAVLSGSGGAEVTGWRPRQVILATSSPDALRVALRQFAYSGWCYSVDGGAEQCAAELSPQEPVPVFDIPAGEHVVDARLVATRVEKTGWWISGAGLLAAAAIAGVLARGTARGGPGTVRTGDGRPV